MSRFKTSPYLAGAFIILLGGSSLAGWLFHVSILKTALPGLVSMQANTAVCLILSGVSLLLHASPDLSKTWQRPTARLLACIVIVAGLLTLTEYGLGTDLGVDRLLFPEGSRQAGGSFPGRMSLATGLDFVLLGFALVTLDWRVRSRDHYPAQYFVLAGGVVALVAFMGNFYGIESLAHFRAYGRIALNTAVAFWLLCIGILFARPGHGIMAVFTSDRPGGILSRRMLPAAILGPLLGGWLCVLGVRAGVYRLGFGSALYATVLIAAFSALIVWAARALNRADAERRQGAEALRQSNARLQAVREEERTRVAREIHDVLAQELTRLKLDIAWMKRQITAPVETGKQAAVLAKLGGMSEVTDTAITSVQRIATELRPIVLDTLGLYAAIEWQARDFEQRTGIQTHAAVPEADPPLQRDHSTALFRILQESLTNVARHSRASQVHIELVPEKEELFLRVRDNGRGITETELENPRSVGIVGMRERASLLGGQCRIGRSPNGGTIVEARLPLKGVS
jgi:signal transduction histidine kinase